MHYRPSPVSAWARERGPARRDAAPAAFRRGPRAAARLGSRRSAAGGVRAAGARRPAGDRARGCRSTSTHRCCRATGARRRSRRRSSPATPSRRGDADGHGGAARRRPDRRAVDACPSPVARRRPSSRAAAGAAGRRGGARGARDVGGRRHRPTAAGRGARDAHPSLRPRGRTDRLARAARSSWTARCARCSRGPGRGRPSTASACTCARRIRCPASTTCPIGSLIPGEVVRVACGRGALGA